MIGVYIKDGEFKGRYGILFTIDGRTCEVVTQDEIIRVDRKFIKPLDMVQSFDAVAALKETLIKE